ncbi:MAG TPA: hypothetical protein VE464_05010 [Streptosporangiaceae bacterium]|jgi:hypothetical protein|nr:hypothetical protein [Streptosporangiaceae bacterium]
MLIKSRMGISADGFVSTPEGVSLDRLELVVLPMLLGADLPLSPPGAPPVPLRLLPADRTCPDGSAELVYTPA